MPKEKASEKRKSEIMPDMKSYFGQMFCVLRLHSHSLSLAGMDIGRSGIDTIRELLFNSILEIGELNPDSFENIWKKDKHEFYKEIERKLDSEEIIPESKLPEEHQGLFQDIRTLYFLAEEKIKEEDEHRCSFEKTLIGIPVTLITKMLDKMVDRNLAKKKWDEIRGDKDKVREFYSLTKWKVDDLRGAKMEFT